MSVKITYFVHGTTTDNQQGLATGWLPGDLSETGIKQAEELGWLVRDMRFDTVFCSDLKRSIDSAELAFKGKYGIIIDKRLREADYGDFTGKPADEFKPDLVRYIDMRFPNGESYKDVENRIGSFVGFLKSQYREKHIAIVGHQGPQLALEVLVKGKSWQEAIETDWRHIGSWQPGWEYFVADF